MSRCSGWLAASVRVRSKKPGMSDGTMGWDGKGREGRDDQLRNAYFGSWIMDHGWEMLLRLDLTTILFPARGAVCTLMYSK